MSLSSSNDSLSSTVSRALLDLTSPSEGTSTMVLYRSRTSFSDYVSFLTYYCFQFDAMILPCADWYIETGAVSST